MNFFMLAPVLKQGWMKHIQIAQRNHFQIYEPELLASGPACPACVHITLNLLCPPVRSRVCSTSD
jgi:hypothetical protein